MTVLTRSSTNRARSPQLRIVAQQFASFRYTDFSKKMAKATAAFDMTILMLVGVISIILRWGHVSHFSLGIHQSLLVFLIPITWFISLAWVNAWVFTGLSSPSEIYTRVLRAGALTFATVAGISFIFKEQFSRGYVLLSITIGTALLLLQRKFAKAQFVNHCAEQGIKKNILAVTCCTPKSVVERIQKDFPAALCHSYQVDFESHGWATDLKSYLLVHGIDAVVLCEELANDSRRIGTLVRLLDQLDCLLYLPDALGDMSLRRENRVNNGNAYSVLAEPRIRHSQALFKRATDIAIASAVLILLAPLMVLIALLIKVTSKGRIFFTDFRIGQNGVEFKFPKFRTMREGADIERLSILGRPDADMAQRYKGDPRITLLGKILRRFSLDEIPQFWCVLVGTMSIVGPRPILRQELPQMNNADTYRHLARPGLTGLWQVSGRKETTWSERMALDLSYIQSWSPFTDAVLILRTFRVVLTGKGAY